MEIAVGGGRGRLGRGRLWRAEKGLWGRMAVRVRPHSTQEGPTAERGVRGLRGLK